MKILILLFWSQFTWAQVLLVPDQTVTFETYKVKCEKDGYICTMRFDLDQIQQSGTPKLDALLGQLDYSSETFKNDFIPNVFSILKDEDISIEQVEIILKVIEQLKDFSDVQKQKQFTIIEKQLKEMTDLAKNEELTVLPERFVILFKKALPTTALKKLKPAYFKVKFTISEFNRVPNTANFRVQGECESAQLDASIEIKKWQVQSEKTCGFADQFMKVKTSTGNFVSEHKTSLIVSGLVIVGAAILMNNYEVKFTF